MKVSEKFTENIFEKMNALKAFAWSNVFSTTQMYGLWLGLYGDYEISIYSERKDLDTIASELTGFFTEEWNRKYNLVYSDIANVLGYRETIKETISDDGSTSHDTTEGETEKVSAFNSEDFVNDNNTESTTTDKGTSKNDRTRNYEREGYTDSRIANLERFINILKNEFVFGTIFTDTNKLLTNRLYIY